ncbi:hypothetical protein [Amycolatopsis pigmentata]|uniref:Uncharacterized protein n=1 Tax=Amycolatopsis pigmentata TaxID=450801 RepID=A0ABW5FU20_9PSEU
MSLGPLTLQCGNGTRATLVHPNATGQAATATQVEVAIRRTLSGT